MRRVVRNVAAALLLAGCAGSTVSPPATALLATEAEQKRFAGAWRGRLELPGQPARDLEFRFVNGSATVVSGSTSAAPVLWIRVNGDVISGAVRQYFDQQRGATIYTTFEGTLGADGVLRGILRERVGTEWRDAGTWTATRIGT